MKSCCKRNQRLTKSRCDEGSQPDIITALPDVLDMLAYNGQNELSRYC